MHFYTGAVALVIAVALLPFAWQTLDNSALWGLLLLVGIFGTLGHYLLILGYGRSTPATLTPFLYSQIAFATFAAGSCFRMRPTRRRSPVYWSSPVAASRARG
jgi:drug/metabolite transporter (DMT)-like permease